MSNANAVRTEASLHTVMGGQELRIELPDQEPEGGYTVWMKFLAAVLMRAEEEFGWWEDQVAWYEKQVADLRADIRRESFHVVGSQYPILGTVAFETAKQYRDMGLDEAFEAAKKAAREAMHRGDTNGLADALYSLTREMDGLVK